MLSCKNCADQKVFRRRALVAFDMNENENKVPLDGADTCPRCGSIEGEQKIVSIVHVCTRCGSIVAKEDND